MNYKKLLIASFVVMAALSSQVYAKELQAQVQKNTANAAKPAASSVKTGSQAYPEIARLIEYNHCAEADAKIKELHPGQSATIVVNCFKSSFHG